MNHTPMEVMLDEEVTKLKEQNTELLEALEATLRDHAMQGSMTEETHTKARKAIRKAKEKVK